MSQFRFTKMHGAGNDFIVMDARSHDFRQDAIKNKASSLCNRRTGIGADGVLMLAPSDSHDYTMVYLNADGSNAGMCGNGARCLARFAVDKDFPESLTFESNGQSYSARVNEHNVSIDFPFKPTPELITIDDESWIQVYTGTEHIATFTDDVQKISEDTIRTKGSTLRHRNDLFPTGTNVNFASVIADNHLRLITYEKGVEDLTLACGTGAIATAISWFYTTKARASALSGHVSLTVRVDCPGGPLHVSFDAVSDSRTYQYQNIILHGPAVSVFEGFIHL